MKGATSYKETSFGIIPRSKLVKLEIEGTKRGFEYISELVKKRTVILIAPDIICDIHLISFGWIFPKWAGKYRKIQVTFSNKEAPEYYLVPELMINLCEDLNERLKHLPNFKNVNFIVDVVKLLAWFQHRFVFIHPFNDYNGRTARMIMVLILLNLGLPLIELKAETGKDRKVYISAMQSADDGDYLPLETLISEAISEALIKFKKTDGRKWPRKN